MAAFGRLLRGGKGGGGLWGGGDNAGVPAFVYIIFAFLLVGIIIGCMVGRRYYLRYFGVQQGGGAGVRIAKVSAGDNADEEKAANETGPSGLSGRRPSPVPSDSDVMVQALSTPGEVERPSLRKQSTLRATGDASREERRAHHEQRAEQLQRQINSLKEQAARPGRRSGSKERAPGALYGTRTSWDGTPADAGGGRASDSVAAPIAMAPKFDFAVNNPEVARLQKQVAEELTSSSGEAIDVRRKNFRMLCLRWHSSRNQGEDSRKAENVYNFLMQQRDWYLTE